MAALRSNLLAAEMTTVHDPGEGKGPPGQTEKRQTLHISSGRTSPVRYESAVSSVADRIAARYTSIPCFTAVLPGCEHRACAISLQEAESHRGSRMRGCAVPG